MEPMLSTHYSAFLRFRKTIAQEYMSYRDAIDRVKQQQPDILKRSPIVTQLRNMVAENCHNKGLPVKFFTAVGTPLDIYHGVDGFFEQGNTIVTVDVSMKDKETYKADVLLQVGLDTEGNLVVDQKEMQKIAHDIAHILNSGSQKLAA